MMAENPASTRAATPSTTDGARGTGAATASATDFSAIAESMERTQSAVSTGSYAALAGETTPQPLPAESTTTPATPQGVYSVSSQVVTARPAEMAVVTPAPGLTERGWSTEVTARHPELLAVTMEELAAEGKISPRSADPIDPNDEASLRQALNELGARDVIKNNLRVAAASLNGERLAAAQEALRAQSDVVRAAVAEAVAEAKADAAARATARGEKRAAGK